MAQNISIFGEEYISPREHERGLRSFDIMRITDAFNMPANFYPCMESDPIKAQQEAYWAMHLPDHNYNVALHFGLQKAISHDDFTNVEQALTKLPVQVHGMTIEGRIRRNIGSFSATMRGYLNEAKHEISAHDELWINFGERVMQSYAKGFEKSDLSYIHYGASGDLRRKGLEQIITHVHEHEACFMINDRAFSSQNVAAMKLDQHNNTLIADSGDIEASSSALGYQYNKAHVHFYEAPPLVPITFKTAGAPEDLAVHSPMVNTGTDSMERTVWGMITNYDEASISGAYKAQYDECVKRIQKQAFHQRNVEVQP